MITVIEHDGFDWKSEVVLDLTELILIIDKYICDNMWMILLVINNNVKKLLSEKVVWSLLV